MATSFRSQALIAIGLLVVFALSLTACAPV